MGLLDYLFVGLFFHLIIEVLEWVVPATPAPRLGYKAQSRPACGMAYGPQKER